MHANDFKRGKKDSRILNGAILPLVLSFGFLDANSANNKKKLKIVNGAILPI